MSALPPYHRAGLEVALEQARIGFEEGGIPIGAALWIDGSVVGRGRNRRLQQGDPILHAEMDCLRDAGRLTAPLYRRATLYTTLSPCAMCSGAVLLYRIPRLVIGERRSFRGEEDWLSARGVELVHADAAEAYELMQRFVAARPDVWHEDIGE